MSTILIDNLRLINNKHLIYLDESGKTYPSDIVLKDVKQVYKVPEFELNINDYELIIFVLENENVKSEIIDSVSYFVPEMIIYQKSTKNDIYNSLFPKTFSLMDPVTSKEKKYYIRMFILLDIPNIKLKIIPDIEVNEITDLGNKYTSKPLDYKFFEFFNTVRIKTSISLLFEVPRSYARRHRNKQYRILEDVYSDDINTEEISTIATDKDMKKDSTSDIKSEKITPISSDDSIGDSIPELSINTISSNNPTLLDLSIPDLSNIINLTQFVVLDITEIVGEKEEQLGSGSYGKVFRTTKNIAIKEFPFKDDDEYEYEDNIEGEVNEGLSTSTLREITILKYLKHPNIINLYAMQLYPESFAMPIANGTLDNYHFNTIQQRKFIFYQIFSGLAYIHSKNIWHLDMKPQNILVFEEKSKDKGYVTIVKIADFGISLFRPRLGKNSTEVATLYWKPLELLLSDKYYNELVDVWGVGVMLLEHILKQNIMIVESDIALVYKIFRLLGTPNEKSYPGVTKLRTWKKDFPLFERTFETIFDIQFDDDGNSEGSESMDISESSDESIDLDEDISLGEDIKMDKIPNKESDSNMKFPIHEDEYEVLFHTLTWKNKRYSANQILKLHYWKDIEEEIQTRIPSKEIETNILQTYMKEQKQPLQQRKLKAIQRRNSYIRLWNMGRILRIEKRTIFYTFYMMDMFEEQHYVGQDHMLYCTGMLKIITDLFEQYTPSVRDYAYLLGSIEYERRMVQIERDILYILDFDLSYPIAVDFIYEYLRDPNKKIRKETNPDPNIVKETIPDLNTVKEESSTTQINVTEGSKFEYDLNFIDNLVDLKVTNYEYDKVLYYLYILTLDYRFAVLLTQAQLAQIAIKAAGVETDVTKKLPNMYHGEFKDYIRDYSPTSWDADEHSFYFREKV